MPFLFFVGSFALITLYSSNLFWADKHPTKYIYHTKHFGVRYSVFDIQLFRCSTFIKFTTNLQTALPTFV